MTRSASRLILTVLAMLACASGERAPEAFCQTLEGLREGRIEVEAGNPNEFVGHVHALEALIEVAPGPVQEDLGRVRDALVAARDTGGWRTLLDFAGLQDPELAGAEGRVADFAAQACGIRDADLAWHVDRREPEPPRCPAWPRVGSPLTINRFPYLIATAGANYFSTQFWSVPFVPAPPGFLDVPRGGSVRFEGEYPHARYFAYHPNDYETNNFPRLLDEEIAPDPGSANPWTRPPTAGEGRRYTAHLVFDEAPQEPAANTVYVGRTGSGKWNPVVFLILRIYAADQGALPPNSAGVPLPAVTILDAEGRVVDHHEACDPYPPGTDPPTDETLFPAFPVPDHRAVFQPGDVIFESNFGLPVTLLANGDVVYLAGFHSRMWGEVYAVRARKPRTPSRRLGIPLHAKDVDLRLFTVCNYNFWSGRAHGCTLDEDIVADDAGNYTLLASDALHRPGNAVAARGVTWIDTGPFLDGQLTWRILLSQDRLAAQLRRAVTGGEVAPEARAYLPDVAQCSKATFEAGGFDACKAVWQDVLAGRQR